MKNILVSTIGGSWQIVPELLGFTNPGYLDLYRNHADSDRISETRKKFSIAPVKEIWVVATAGRQSTESVTALIDWIKLLPENGKPVIRFFRVAGTDDLASEAECAVMAECIFRIVFHAATAVRSGQLLLSLAGGRKTMSSDMQAAASIFGCRALLHVIDNGDKAFRSLNTPGDFIGPLAERWNKTVTPLATGFYEASAVIAMATAEREAIQPERFPVLAAVDGLVPEMTPEAPFLKEEIETLGKKAAFLLCNYSANKLKGETSSNFLALYSLRPETLRKLKDTRIGVDPAKETAEIAWLQKLPKAELHCHFGGAFDAAEMIQIAAANREALFPYSEQLKPFLENWKRRLSKEAPEEIGQTIDWKADIRNRFAEIPKPLGAAAFLLLFENDPEMLDRVIFGPCCAPARFCGIGIGPYEKLGDLQGSGLLQSEESLRVAARLLGEKALRHNVRYLELRCSPVNYKNGGLTPDAVVRIIDDEMTSFAGRGLRYGMLFIASRHGEMGLIKDHVTLAGRLLAEKGGPFEASFRGFDLAGSETAMKASAMRESFLPMMERCLHITIHAGETAKCESIWEAVYHLSAERIGHGLTLRENPALKDRFRDRSIALEMCPSSNFQIVGFKDAFIPETAGRNQYPLKEYLDEGLRVTVNTDNPGISRTDFSAELHRAARLTDGGLSPWEILILIRNSFKAAFIDRPLRQQLLIEAEKEIIQLIQEELDSWT